MSRALTVAVLSLAACGYRAQYAGEAPERLHVVIVRSAVADAIAADEVASGVREELARQGALEAGQGWPRVEIEVLRADETSEGIAARAGAAVARGSDVALVARAWVARSEGAAPERDTGDLRAADVVANEPNARASGFRHADALRAAARRLGQSIARRIAGLPAASDETSP